MYKYQKNLCKKIIKKHKTNVFHLVFCIFNKFQNI